MKTLPIKLLLLFSLFVVIYSCEKDDNIVKQQNNLKTVALEEAKGFLTQSLEQSKSNSEQGFITSISDEINYEAITNIDEQLAVIPVTTAYENLYSRIVLLEIEGKLESVILSLNTFESTTRDNFSGEMLITDMNGNYIRGLRIENNTVVSYYVKSNIKTDKNNFSFNTTNAKSDCENECTFSVCDYCGELGEVVVTAPSQPHNTYISIEVMFPDRDFGLNLGDYDYNYGGGGSGSGSNNDEDRIKNELDDPCAKNIFTELEIGSLEQKLKQTMNPETNIFITFHQSILNLFNESSSTHLTIQNDNTDSNAFTVNTTITMGNGYLANATELSIARTMIHESIHAYINGLYYRDSSFHDSSFREKLRRWAGDNGYSDWSVIQHEFMGGYVDAIAISLLQWDTDYGTGGNLGWDYYQSMAFAGLVNKKIDENGNPILDNNGNFIYEDTDSFKDLVPNENDRNEIKKINIDEATGNNDAKGSECG